MAGTETKKRAGIQSVEIGMRVLDTLATLGGAHPLAAIVKGCGLSPSQTHRYLASLIEAGMVKQDANGDYDLGSAALRLGLSALSRIDVFKIADDRLSAFSIETGATVLLAALGPTGPIIVRWHVGRPPIATSLGLGSNLSLLHSATGQIFLAFRPERELETLVATELRQSPSMNIDDLQRIKNKVRKNGEASVGGTLIPGLNAKAYPIFDLQSQAILAATWVTTTGRGEQTKCPIAQKLRLVCEEISRSVGGRAPCQ
ncbi:iclR helix-turn-helix domain protein (plasmid) [Blastomonas sp. RAC04]|uniref:IclR family transcriptional regulator n=1 Tax=Blastomonas sp. RAC04 TaxID=1842535 RepID=UPI00083D6DDD|nr:IclR family transcriptional regulator [Blastomonas sp. RAC04]AOF98685.1 iclR helix-turn-helix domain protein [Blastomonas sp. RAC04]